jgi:hypothetical protein
MGPTVAIWLAQEHHPPTVADLLEVAHLLDAAAESSTVFTVRTTAPIGGTTQDSNGRPFGINVGDTGFVQASEELLSIEKALGYVPTSAIHVFAFANAKIDHRILAELAIYFARRFGGLIDFGGTLGEICVATGKLFSIPYSAGSLPPAFHVGDSRFLEQWLSDPCFHMVK